MAMLISERILIYINFFATKNHGEKLFKNQGNNNRLKLLDQVLRKSTNPRQGKIGDNNIVH